jgi:hypothetical protein
LLRFSQAVRNRQFILVLGPSPLESAIMKQELNHIPLPGTNSPTERPHVPLRHSPQPRPRLAQSMAATREHFFEGKLTCEKGSGERRDERRL